jgi:uncharacterized SAM-binding protein YcdF (DUF218 family)
VAIQFQQTYPLMSDHLQLFLSKLLPLAVLPEGIITLMLVGIAVSAWRGAHRLASLFAVSALVIFWVSANPVVADRLMATLENQHPVDPSALPKADVAIVLGGAVYNPSPPRQEPELGEAVDRVWYAARLYRSGHVTRIVVVGGNLPWWPGALSEAALIQKLLVDLGVPASSIQIGGTSRNTFENAVEAKALMQAQPFESALLITSAWHMPRALAIFKKAGFPIVPAPCDFRTNDELSGTLLDWVPNAQAFAMTSAALREWMGFYVYRWRGWL